MWNIIVRKLAINHKDGKSGVENAGDHNIWKAVLDYQSPSKTLIQQLLCYVSRQWLNKSTIGLSRLSVRYSPSRTNNAAQNVHAALHLRIKLSLPNFFAFLGHFQQTTVDYGSHPRLSRLTSAWLRKRRRATCFSKKKFWNPKSKSFVFRNLKFRKSEI